MTDQNAKILASLDEGPKKCSVRLQPRAMAELHDLERSHYNWVRGSVDQIATHISDARNDKWVKGSQ